MIAGQPKMSMSLQRHVCLYQTIRNYDFSSLRHREIIPVYDSIDRNVNNKGLNYKHCLNLSTEKV